MLGGLRNSSSGLEEVGWPAARILVPNPASQATTHGPLSCKAAPPAPPRPAHLAQAHNVRMPQLHVVCYLALHILVDVLRAPFNELERHLRRAAAQPASRSALRSAAAGLPRQQAAGGIGCAASSGGLRGPAGPGCGGARRRGCCPPARPSTCLARELQSQRRHVQGPGSADMGQQPKVRGTAAG